MVRKNQPSPRPREWVSKTLRLQEDHGWKCRPGFKVFVADRGAVRFDIPDHWIIVPGETNSIKFHDKTPPEDDCVLEMTVFYLDDRIDWSQLELGPMVDQLRNGNEVEVTHRGETVVQRRGKLEIAWGENRYIDPEEDRPARSRLLVARWSNIQPLITFAFWEDHAAVNVGAWAELLRTLELGSYVEDPTKRLLD